MKKIKNFFEKKKNHSFRQEKNPFLEESIMNNLLVDESKIKLKSKSIEKDKKERENSIDLTQGKEIEGYSEKIKINGRITKKQILQNDHEKTLITCLLPIKNNTKLASSSVKSVICIFSFDKIKKEFALEKTLIGHKDKITCLTKNKEENILYSCSLDCQIKLWDLNTFDCILTITENSPALNMINTRLNNIIVGFENKQLKIWNEKGEFMDALDAQNKFVLPMIEIKGNVLITNDNNGTLYFWDTQYFIYIYYVKNEDPVIAVRSILYEEDSNQLLIGGKGDIAIFDLKQRRVIHKVYIGFSGNIMSLIRLYDGNYISGMWQTECCQIIQIGKSFKKLNTFEKMINFFCLLETNVIFYPFSEAINCAILFEGTNLFIVGDSGGHIISWEY